MPYSVPKLPGLIALGIAFGFTTAQNITSDSFFYGESPAVAAPTGTGVGDWAAAYAKAEAFVAQLSLEEKVNLTFGVSESNGCSGNIPAIERLGFPGLCLSDAGNGVRSTDFVNSYASGIHVGATWNRNLTNQRGIHMGGEFKTKGVNVALGPVVGPLGRVVEAGRNWEGFSNDPYLCGALAFETVDGFKSVNVQNSVKHYIGNEQETDRNPSTSGGKTIEAVSSNIDDKTIHEAYLWPFQDAVRAGASNFMCSYNRVNNSYGCQNSKTLNGLLKTELGFQGFVVSDWGAQHSGVASSLSGLDMAMPSSAGMWGGGLLVEAVNNGSIPESRVTDQATRIIASWYQLGQDAGFPEPGVGMPASLTAPHTAVIAKDPTSKQTLFDLAVEGHVLVKNVNNALPLNKPNLVSVFGYDARAPAQEDVGNNGWVSGAESLESSTSFLGTLTTQIAQGGTILSGGGSGANSPSYINAPLDALQEQAYLDNTMILWDTTNANATGAVDAASDVCLVFINAFASEGSDRPGLHDDFSDALVNNIADQCSNTVVVIHNAGIRLVDQWIDHPNVTALIFAHAPGQDSGRALVSILYGTSNPSGRLPYTVAKNESDYGAVLKPSLPETPFGLFPQSNFSEGVFIDYRAFDAKNITPRYEFGFGLSYTTFSYSNLAITTPSNASANGTAGSLGPFPTGEILPGGAADLWDTLSTVTATITNSGEASGAEVAQLYVGIPGGPVKQLRGFEKVTLTSGESQTVEFALTRRDLSTWDTIAQKWRLQSGTYSILVGASSRNLPLTGTLAI